MNSVSIGEIQKNISLITKLKDAVMIIDKRKNREVAVIYPVGEESVVDSLAGKYKKQITATADLEKAKEEAFKKAMEEKYGLSD